MRKLALLTVAIASFGLFLSPPAEAQTPCRGGTALCMGDKNHDIIIGGNVIWTSPDGGSSHTPSTGVSGTQSTGKFAALDAGVGRINGDLTVIGTGKIEVLDAGAANFQGQVGINRPLHCGAAAACGTVALVSGTPSTQTATVESGSTCFCWPVGTTAAIAAGGCAANVSSTTATFTGPNTVTTTVGYVCYK